MNWWEINKEELKSELKERRALVRSLIRPRDPNVHWIEGLQKDIRDIKEELVTRFNTRPKKSKYD